MVRPRRKRWKPFETNSSSHPPIHNHHHQPRHRPTTKLKPGLWPPTISRFEGNQSSQLCYSPPTSHRSRHHSRTCPRLSITLRPSYAHPLNAPLTSDLNHALIRNSDRFSSHLAGNINLSEFWPNQSTSLNQWRHISTFHCLLGTTVR